ncbi:MAG TPA: alpha/beta hydrolase [Acidimicrobiia bacterium]
MRGFTAIPIVAFSLIAVGCSSDSGGNASDSTSTTIPAATTTTAAAAATTTTAAAATTTTAAAATTTTAEPSFVETTDLVYMTIGDAELLVDVYTPVGDGPWPVVVAFHGIDSDGKDGDDTATLAEAAVAEGLVVFAPSWIVWRPPIPPVPVPLVTFREWTDAASCAVAFAQQNAPDFGGDPANTIVYGFSAGAGVGLAASMDANEDPIPGCSTDSPPAPVTGAVLGDGEYWLHSENFDPAFEADPAAMQAELAALMDPASWPTDLDAKFHLWVADDGTSPRAIDDPSDPSGWFALRDPDGSIQRDLERLDQFDDGTVTFIDAGQLLELRLSEAGIEVTMDEYPGGHTPLNKVAELVAYLKTAAR